MVVNVNVTIDGKGLAAVVDLTRDAAAGFGELVKTITQTYAPQLRVWAARNLYRCKEKLDAENTRRRLAGNTPIPIRFALPALAKIAEEDDEDILELWARLLANLQDPERRLKPNKVFVHVLSEMEPLDAATLRYASQELRIEQATQDAARTMVVMRGKKLQAAADHLRASPAEMRLSLQNLTRLGCFDYVGAHVASEDPNRYTSAWIFDASGAYFLTPFGSTMFEACVSTTPRPVP